MSGIAGIVSGRLLDARGPRVVMTLGSAFGAGALVIVATAPNLFAFGLGWVVVGLPQSAVLYQAASTVLSPTVAAPVHDVLALGVPPVAAVGTVMVQGSVGSEASLCTSRPGSARRSPSLCTLATISP